jgi:uncharacterized protein (DUF2336 family)
MRNKDHCESVILLHIDCSSFSGHAGGETLGGRTPRTMTAKPSLIDELEQALASGTDAHRVEMLTRITDLFLAGASRYSDVQINLFDEVITKLTIAIESKARARLAIRLADNAHAPTGVIRRLAADDDIEVARPVLKGSKRLDEADILATARSKGQHHLLAISERTSLSEAVTDVLVTRGDREVAHSVAKNAGARFSDAGFRILVKRSASDEGLAVQVGSRRDLPRQHFLALLDQASATVRNRLAMENPRSGAAVANVLTEVVGGIRTETRKVSDGYAAARQEVLALRRAGHLGESEVYRFAREGRFEQTAVALSMLCGIEIDAVEHALQEQGHEIVLILAKLAGFSSTGAKALLLLKTADRGISAQDLDHALKSYDQLQVATAQRVLGFYRTRLQSQSLTA